MLIKRVNKGDRTTRDIIRLDPTDSNQRIVHHKETFPHTQQDYEQMDHIPNAVFPNRGHARVKQDKDNTFMVPSPVKCKVPLDPQGRPKRTWMKVEHDGWKWV
jgi:hypothetical protein